MLWKSYYPVSACFFSPLPVSYTELNYASLYFLLHVLFSLALIAHRS
jgi:hypothetical protein